MSKKANGGARTMEEWRREAARDSLQFAGTIAGAARMLGISRNTLLRIMRTHQLRRPK
jgi:transcriptional regulator of acetoin/glycerol metabolism